jgi:hypothetical protein
MGVWVGSWCGGGWGALISKALTSTYILLLLPLLPLLQALGLSRLGYKLLPEWPPPHLAHTS